MMGKKVKMLKFLKDVVKDSDKSETYNTGLLGEHIIVSAWKKQPVSVLEKYRYILNGIIKKKKEMQRVNANKEKHHITGVIE